MKILFLVAKLDTPSTRWRVLQLIPHFQKAGLECRVEELPGGMLGKLSTVKLGLGCDIVFLQKRLLPKLVSARLRRCARKLVFEFDDALTLKKGEEGVNASSTRERRFRRIVEAADAVVAANEHFAEEARRVAKDPALVHVIPSAIDLSRWDAPATARAEGAGPVIGWSGSAPNLQYLELVAQPLMRLTRHHPGLVLRVVCEETLTLPGVNIDHRKFNPSAEGGDLRSFDVAIAPQVEDLWTRGRVSTKVLAYFAAGLPVVASDVASHRIYIRNGENGYLAGTLGQWEERLEALLKDPALRQRLGAAGRATAESQFSIEAVVPRYLELFGQLAKG